MFELSQDEETAMRRWSREKYGVEGRVFISNHDHLNDVRYVVWIDGQVLLATPSEDDALRVARKILKSIYKER